MIEIEEQLLKDLIEEIAMAEESYSYESGMCRSAEELDKAGEIPECYYEAKKLLRKKTDKE